MAEAYEESAGGGTPTGGRRRRRKPPRSLPSLSAAASPVDDYVRGPSKVEHYDAPKYRPSPAGRTSSSTVGPIKYIKPNRPKQQKIEVRRPEKVKYESVNFFKNAPGIGKTLLELRTNLNNDEEFSYLLKDMLEQRYDMLENKRDRMLDRNQNQIDNYQSRALDAVSDGDTSFFEENKAPELLKMPGRLGIQPARKSFLEELSNAQTQEEKEAVLAVWKPELERRNSIKNKYADHYTWGANSVDSFRNSLENALRDEGYEGSVDDLLQAAQPPVGNQQKPGKGKPGKPGEPGEPAAPSLPEGTENLPWPLQVILGAGRQFSSTPEGAPTRLGSKSSGLGIRKTAQETSAVKELAMLAPIAQIVLPDGAEQKYREIQLNMLNSAPVEGGGNVLLWAMDKLSRPIYAVNNAVRETNRKDDDAKSNADLTLVDWLTGAGLTGGKSLFDSVDDINLQDIGDIGSAFNRGFTGEDKTTGDQVWADAAKRDKTKDWKDKEWIQTVFGLGSDVIIDPLNFVGIGLVKKPLDVIRVGSLGAKRLEQTRKLSDEVAAILADEPSELIIGPQRKPLEADEYYNLMTGGNVKLPRNAQQRKLLLNKRTEGADYIAGRLEQAAGTKSSARSNRALDEYRSTRERMTKLREEVLNTATMDSFLDEVMRETQLNVYRGNLTPEELDEFSNAITTNTVAGVMGEANKRSSFLGNAAKKMNETRLINDDFEVGSWSQVKKSYENKVANYERLKADGADSFAVEAAKRSMDQYALKMDEALTPVDGAAVPRSISELLGSKFQNDYHFAADDIDELFDQTRLKYNRESTKLSDRSSSLKAQIASKTKELSTSKDPKATKRLRQQISALETVKRSADRKVFLGQADAFVNVLKAKLSEGAGSKAYVDATRTRGLEKLIGEVQAQKAAMGDNDVPYTGLEQVDERPTEFLDAEGNYGPETLEPSGAFMSKREHLDYVEKTAKSQMKENQVFRNGRLQNLPPSERKMLSGETPEELLTVTSDGEFSINQAAFKKAFEINTYRGDVVAKSDDAWSKNVAETLQWYYHDRKDQILKNIGRRKNESKATENALGKYETGESNKLLDMFRPNDKGALMPFVTIDGRPVDFGSTDMLKSIKVEKQHEQLSVTYIKGLDEVLKGTDFNNTQDLVNYLWDSGVPIPRDLDNANGYLRLHHESLRLKLRPEEIAGRNLFKAQHNMSIGDAMIWRDKHLGNTVVDSFNGPWSKKFPQGITRTEYFGRALNSKQEFNRLFENAPFSVRVGNRPSFKQMKGKHPNWATMPAAKRQALSEKWAEDSYDVLMKMPFKDRYEFLGRVFTAAKTNQTKANKAAETAEKSASGASKVREPFSKADYTKAQNEAKEYAYDYVTSRLDNNTLYTKPFDSSIELNKPVGSQSSISDLREALTYKVGQEKAQLMTAKFAAQQSKQYDEVKIIEQKMARAQEKLQTKLKLIKRSEEIAKITRAATVKRLQEDVIFNIAEMPVAETAKGLALVSLGKEFTIPGTRAMFKAAAAVGDLPIIAQTRQLYMDALISPASRLSDPAQDVLNRAYGHTPNIIEYHVNVLKKTLGTIDPKTRQLKLKTMMRGGAARPGDDPAYDAVKASLDELLPYFSGETKVGDATLTWQKIQEYLPDNYKLDAQSANKYGVTTVEQLVRSVKTNKGAKSGELDPYEMSWNLRIAVELAQSRLALEHTIKNSFGVRRIGQINSNGQLMKPKDPVLRAKAEAVDKLGDMGWKQVPELGAGHWFPQESAEDVQRLLKMMEPRNMTEMGKSVDQALTYWKTAVTMYNPGYYTRNAIGETMSSYLAGVHNPVWYKKAGEVSKFMKNEGRELDVLRKQFALEEHVASDSVSGSKVVTHLKDGTPVTIEDIVVAYHDTGLKTGFFSTEFPENFNRIGDKIRSNKASAPIAKGHDALRNAGEGFEDYFRIAHFMHAVNKSKGKTLQDAAQDAAKEVRKWHFDYTDFTPLEKTVMMRAFPFYKWTRKALPLMLTTLMTKPGKIMQYPKGMDALSDLTTDDIDPYTNGYAPNYEGNVLPFIQDLWSYKIAEYGDDEEMFFNVATPQMDIYKMLQSPQSLGNQAYGMFNPFAKFGAEQVAGTTLGDDIGATNFGYETRSPTDALKHLMRQFPQGNFGTKMMGEDGADLGQGLSFGTGLGFYKNVNLAEEQAAEAAAKAKKEEPKSLINDEGSSAPVGMEDFLAALNGGRKTPEASLEQGLTTRGRKTPKGSQPKRDPKPERAANNDGYQMPVKGFDLSSITSDFGPRIHPITGAPSNHTGADFGAPEGTPIFAAKSGFVSQANLGNSVYGNQVILDHGRNDQGAGEETMYGHMRDFVVKPGQRVKKGDIIGYVGSTGMSTGPHLHWETWLNGEAQNPVSFLGGS